MKDPTKPPQPALESPADPARRSFLQVVGLGLAAPVVLKLGACDDDSGEAAIELGEAYFPQGIASGDPRPDSVVLWARAFDTQAAGDLDVTLLIGTSETLSDTFAKVSLTATADNDHIVKVKVSGLDPGTRYFYRFVYEAADKRWGSRIARTKTAPAPDADVEVKVALASCQDFIGRYYNSYAQMLAIADSLDVVLHVGDYIYETTGDLSFQSGPEGKRKVEFADTAGAIAFRNEEGEVTYYAAQSLSNYRDLYKIYRSDRWLQLVHERVPFIFIWDDHEFSDDCWGDTATYFDGKVDENHQTTRRKNAERAWFEHQPTELGLAADGRGLAIGGKTPIADASSVIYGDFRFGKHVHLILTDTRTYRPDHAVGEDVNPARVAMTQAELVAAGFDPQAKTAADMFVYPPYVDLDDAALSAYRPLLSAALVDVYAAALPDAPPAELNARAEREAVGLWSAAEINKQLAAAITAGTVAALDVSDTTTLPRGVTYNNMRYVFGALFASGGLGARYLVEKRHYEAFQKARWARDPKTQDVLGAAQEAWFRQTLSGSDATWKVVATSISFTPMIVSAASYPAKLAGDPDEALIRSGLALFNTLLPSPYLLNVDHWDGFPEKRDELLALMRGTPNCVLLSGDIHSFYATNHGKGDGAHGVVELTGAGISSESFKGFVRGVVDGLVPGISQAPNAAAVIAHLEDLFQDQAPQLTWANNDSHGFFAATFGASQASATAYVAPIEHVIVDAGEDSAAAIAAFEQVSFAIKDGVLTKS